MHLPLLCIQATGAILLALETDQARVPFASLLQPMLGALGAVLQAGLELEAREIVTTLSEVAENAVDFFRSGLVSARSTELTLSTWSWRASCFRPLLL